MDKLIHDVEEAAHALRDVARHLHMPLDTSRLERALKALLDAHRKASQPVKHFVAEKPAADK